MKKGSRSLLRQLLYTSVTSLGLVVLLVAGFAASRLRSDALTASREQLLSSAGGAALELQTVVEGTLSTAESVAQILARIKADEDRLEIGRLEIRGILSSVLQAHPELVSVYTAWEPEGLDGLDAANHDQPGSDSAGRVVPCFTRGAANSLALGTLSALDDPQFNSWYTEPRKTRTAGVFGPLRRHVNGSPGAWVVTAVAPIVQGDTFFGVVGMDISIDALRAVTDRIRLYDGAARAAVHRLDGTLVLGAEGSAAPPTDMRGKRGEAVLIDRDEHSIAIAPLGWLKDDAQWCLSITVPTGRITAPAMRAAGLMVLIGAAGALAGVAWLALRIRHVTGVVRRVMQALESSSRCVKETSQHLNSASQSLAEGASEQAAHLEQTTASLQEVSHVTERNALDTEKAKELARETRAAAEAGAKEMRGMSTAMEAIEASSNNIAKIIKTIDEIAFQTNILALNAAIEAARAGSAGLGFAVVADEVRSLAQRCGQAARETAASIEDSVAKSRRGGELNAEVVRELSRIVDKTREVDELVTRIATANRTQNEGVSQVSGGVVELEKLTQANAARAEESAGAADELSGQARTLQAAVGELLVLVSEATASPKPHSAASAADLAPIVPTQRTRDRGTDVARRASAEMAGAGSLPR